MRIKVKSNRQLLGNFPTLHHLSWCCYSNMLMSDQGWLCETATTLGRQTFISKRFVSWSLQVISLQVAASLQASSGYLQVWESIAGVLTSTSSCIFLLRQGGSGTPQYMPILYSLKWKQVQITLKLGDFLEKMLARSVGTFLVPPPLNFGRKS